MSERHVQKVQQLSTASGYFMRFYELTCETFNYEEAWQAVERERSEVGLPDKYSSYASFRVMKSKYYNSLIRINTSEDE